MSSDGLRSISRLGSTVQHTVSSSNKNTVLDGVLEDCVLMWTSGARHESQRFSRDSTAVQPIFNQSVKSEQVNKKASEKLDRAMLERALELARQSVQRGSSPIGCVIVDGRGQIISEGRNKSAEPWPKTPQRVGNSSFAHAEMDAFYRVKRFEHPEECTVYSSLEPCLMCGGAMGMVQIGRVVWACDDAWGGAGRLIAWNKHPAYKNTEVLASPFPDLEREAAALFAPEAKKVYPGEGWLAWHKRYPEICTANDHAPEQSKALRKVQSQVRRAPRHHAARTLESDA
jgi:tRNA(adenine34) deaminase